MIYKFDEFFSINNVLRKYYKKQQYIKKPWNFCRVCSTKTMETYCVNCKKYTATKNLIAIKSKQKRLMLFSNWAIYGKRKTTFVKNQELNNFNNIWDE